MSDLKIGWVVKKMKNQTTPKLIRIEYDRSRNDHKKNLEMAFFKIFKLQGKPCDRHTTDEELI